MNKKQINSKEQNFSIKSRLKSFTYAAKGIKGLIKNEHNSRVHLFAILVVVPLGFLLSISSLEWIAIVIVIGMVVASELINTAVECLADIVDANWNERIGAVKDYAAGATLVTAIIAAIVGGIVFIPKLMGQI